MSTTESDVVNILNKILHKTVKLEYSNKIIDTGIKECEDLLLKSIAFQFTEIYGRALKHNKNKDDEYEQLYCEYIQEWLNYMKYFYTLGGTCESKKKLWIKYIHNPLQKIEQGFNNNLPCNLNTDKFYDYFQKELIPGSCNDNDTISPMIPLSIGFSIFGIALICMFLYKFTPIKAWFQNHMSKKKESLQYINNEEKHDLTKNVYWNSDSHNEHDMNHITYHPSRL
ncbi:PIR protein [Plasmodium ovale]|uniref:PIR Superfamily Protein n=2 Tax=Plasmodium ovale TaxID=36330 RepID=A0A1A8WJT2_PLAOA|nr:PIR Superfamily Protein [Plasmodium ovale curtisi]SBT83525.1 PIR protein [Plasmodium ovale]